ncbi:MAG: tetratricopeptide repeat protein [Parahaliea sp.]
MSPVMGARQFIAELKTRGVYRTAAYYCAAAWALLQVADLFSPMLGLPDESVTMVLIAAAVGLVPALLLSWWYDLTPDGIVAATDTTVNTSRERSSKPQFIELGLILLLIVSVGYLYVDRLTEDEEALPLLAKQIVNPSIAVMPFTNMSNSQELDHLGDGLAEEILNLLSKFSELDVTARRASFAYRDQGLDTRSLFGQLNVDNLLEGSLRREGQHVRVTVTLLEARRGLQIWSQSYDRDLGSLLGLQEDIARNVVEALQVVLSEQSRKLLSRGFDIDPLAYDYYLKGRNYLRKQVDEANLNTALELFYQAIEISRRFPDAWAGICEAELNRFEIGRDTEHFNNAELACKQALNLDAAGFATHIAQGNLHRVSGRYAEALTAFNQALAINSAAVDAYRGRGKTYADMQQYKNMESDLRKAIQLAPTFWAVQNDLAAYYYRNADYEASVQLWRSVVVLNPNSETALNNLASALFMLGDMALAIESWRQSVVLAPTADTLSNLGTALFYSGDYIGAADNYELALRLTPDDFEITGHLGEALRLLPDQQARTQEVFQKALELGREQLEINSDKGYVRAKVASYLVFLGDYNQARDILNDKRETDERGLQEHYYRAVSFAAMGERQAALSALEAVVRLGYPRTLLYRDANFATLQQWSRFAALTASDDAIIGTVPAALHTKESSNE